MEDYGVRPYCRMLLLVGCVVGVRFLARAPAGAEPNLTTGCAVGDGGVILATSDGGHTWTAQQSGVAVNLWSVWFLDRNNGFVVGDDATVLRTTDAGKTWQAGKYPVRAKHCAVQFVDARTGFVATELSHVLRSQDGGGIWEPIEVAGHNALMAMSFANAQDGLVVGWDPDQNAPCAMRTNDGARTWQETVIAGLRGVHLVSVSHGSRQHAWAVGHNLLDVNQPNGTILASEDGGATWSVQWSHPVTYLYTTSFVDDRVGWAGGYAGSLASPVVLTTQDGGKNWKPHRLPGDEVIAGSALVDPSHGWVVGTGGLIAATDDFGNTWTVQNSGVRASLHAIHFPQVSAKLDPQDPQPAQEEYEKLDPKEVPIVVKAELKSLQECSGVIVARYAVQRVSLWDTDVKVLAEQAQGHDAAGCEPGRALLVMPNQPAGAVDMEMVTEELNAGRKQLVGLIKTRDYGAVPVVVDATMDANDRQGTPGMVYFEGAAYPHDLAKATLMLRPSQKAALLEAIQPAGEDRAHPGPPQSLPGRPDANGLDIAGLTRVEESGWIESIRGPQGMTNIIHGQQSYALKFLPDCVTELGDDPLIKEIAIDKLLQFFQGRQHRFTVRGYVGDESLTLPSSETLPVLQVFYLEEERPVSEQAGVSGFDFGPDPGDLSVLMTDGRPTRLSNPKARISGSFTYYGGVQTFHFVSPTGQAYVCPGTIYLGLSKSRQGGIDWAFVVKKDAVCPDWVEALAQESRRRVTENVFLGDAKHMIGKTRRVLLLGPMRENQGRWEPLVIVAQPSSESH